MEKTSTMTLGEFKKWTKDLSDDICLNISYGGAIYPIKAMDSLNDDNIVFGGDLYRDTNIMGSIRVAAFCKKKK